MKQRRIFLEIRGGCYESVTNLPNGFRIEVIDWDNLLGDEADTQQEWKRLDTEAQTFVEENYPADYENIVRRLESLVRNSKAGGTVGNKRV